MNQFHILSLSLILLLLTVLTIGAFARKWGEAGIFVFLGVVALVSGVIGFFV